MKIVAYFIFFTLVGYAIFSDNNSSIAFGLTISIALRLLMKSNDSFMFREWALLLYAVNYLLSPAITYHLESDKIMYLMKISSDRYFSMAIPGFLLLALGMLLVPTRIFKPNFKEISKSALLNERYLFWMTLFGLLIRVASGFFSSELAFFMYLLSLVRFVGVFALFALNPVKYRLLALIILGFEVYNGFKHAMFHDAIMWLIFYALFYLYIRKPNLLIRIFGGFSLVVFVLLIQAFKSEYRDRVWVGGASASLETISDVGFEKANSEDLAGENNLLATLNRGNQAWIFASTVDNMDRTRDFQAMNNVNLYLEAAFLPRFLAPDKITAGNGEIFNKFSGHQINSSTSMGLGVFADGYIAYGQLGVFVFSFFLGLLFSLTFKLVEGWTRISPFYVLLILPILNYAVRPDCELQTTINHLAKSVLVYGGFVNLTKYRFTLNSTNIKTE
jgi:hypothetical protein